MGAAQCNSADAGGRRFGAAVGIAVPCASRRGIKASDTTTVVISANPLASKTADMFELSVLVGDHRQGVNIQE